MGRARGFISFKVTDCDSCHEQRQVAQPCPSCGAKPKRHEVDYAVQDRQRRIAQLGPAAPVPPDLAPLTIDSILEDVTSGVLKMHKALGKVVDQHTPMERFQQARSDFDTLRARAHLPLPRPHRNQGRAAAAHLDAAHRSFQTFLQAAVSPDIAQTQKLQVEAQRHLDEASTHLARLSPTSETVELKAMDILAHNPEGKPANFLETIDRIDAETPAPHGPHANGSGLSAMVNQLAADALLDREHFDVLLHQALQIADKPEVAAIANDPEWVHQHQLATTRAAGDMAKLSRTLTAPDTTDAECLDALMGFVDDLREVRLRYVLAALLKVDGHPLPPGGRGKGVNGVGDLIRKAKRWPGLDLENTLDSDLRNIAAHRDYHLDGSDVVLDSRLNLEATRHSLDDFIDMVLAQLELVMALETALEIALTRHGHTIPTSPHANTHLRETALSFALAAAGLTHPQFQWLDDHLTITAHGTTAKFPPLVDGLTTALPDHVNSLTINCDDHAVTADATAFRAYHSRGQIPAYEEIVALMSTCAAMRVDGDAVCPTNDGNWTTFVYWVAVTTQPQGLGPLVRELRRAQAICERAECEAAIEVCKNLIQAARAGTLPAQDIPVALRR